MNQLNLLPLKRTKKPQNPFLSLSGVHKTTTKEKPQSHEIKRDSRAAQIPEGRNPHDLQHPKNRAKKAPKWHHSSLTARASSGAVEENNEKVETESVRRAKKARQFDASARLVCVFVSKQHIKRHVVGRVASRVLPSGGRSIAHSTDHDRSLSYVKIPGNRRCPKTERLKR